MNKIVTRLSDDGCVVRINNELGTIHKGDEVQTEKNVLIIKSYDFSKNTFWATEKNDNPKTFEISAAEILDFTKIKFGQVAS